MTRRATLPWRGRVMLPGFILAAVAVLLLALGLTGGDAAPASSHAMHRHSRDLTASELALRLNMRALWEEHVTWTRMAVVDFAAGAPSLPSTERRLLRNQADIGHAIAPFYGRAAGARLTGLLREHILIAVDVLTAAKANDRVALDAAQARWGRNADQIADFLWRANPTAWRRSEMRTMMRAHLALTTREAVARLTGDWSGDVRAFDAVEAQSRHMADMLSSGIVAQFPQRFR